MLQHENPVLQQFKSKLEFVSFVNVVRLLF